MGVLGLAEAILKQYPDLSYKIEDGSITVTPPTSDGFSVSLSLDEPGGEAVAFAVEVQLAMSARNTDLPEDRQVHYRIGINIGDIIVEGDDIYGDGVNIAARLESLAQPGGICVRRNVRNQVRDKLDLDYEDRGDIKVKNIARPIRVFSVVLDDKAEAMVTQVVAAPIITSHRRWMAIAAVLVLGLFTASGLAWWHPWAPDVDPASVEQMALALGADPEPVRTLLFEQLGELPQLVGDFLVARAGHLGHPSPSAVPGPGDSTRPGPSLTSWIGANWLRFHDPCQSRSTRLPARNLTQPSMRTGGSAGVGRGCADCSARSGSPQLARISARAASRSLSATSKPAASGRIGAEIVKLAEP